VPLGRAVRRVARIWLLSRIFTVGAVGLLAFVAGEDVADVWRQWDAGWFLDIAANGYDIEPQGAAFYPLYPALLWAGGGLLGGHPVLAAFLLAFPLTLAAFASLYALARHHVDEPAATRAVAYLAFFPYAFFLQAVYSEAAFLVLAVGAFLAAERRRFAVAGALAGGAMLTRPVGFALLAGLVVLAISSRRRLRDVAGLGIAPLLFCVFPIVLAIEGHSPLAFVSSERHWRDLGPLGWLRGAAHAVDGAATGTVDLVTSLPDVPLESLLYVTQLLTLIAFAALSVIAWRRLGAGYGVYCLLSLAMPVSAPADPWPYVSLERFALALFPCFIVLGALVVRENVHRLLLGAGVAAGVGVIALWVTGSFVA
jgi:Dolichyl-phosphate-mannose-protein mannosyltransferase